MSSLNDSLRAKAAGQKAPAKSGQAPLLAETPTGKAGRVGPVKPGVPAMGNDGRPQSFIERLGVKTDSGKTVGHF